MDQHHFADFGVGEHMDVPFQCVHHAFEYHARLQPDATAVEHLDDSISYGDLEYSANYLASHLRDSGVGPGSRVSILVHHSIHMIVGILAILKTGGAYVPLDAESISQATLGHILRDSQSVAVVAPREYLPRLQDSGIVIIPLDAVVLRGREKLFLKSEDRSIPSSSACVLYTSESVDRPRGVDITHGNFVNLFSLPPGRAGMEPGQRVAQSMNIGSALASWEILGSLSNGCTLCIRGTSSKEWRALMKTVDVVITAPSNLLSHDPSDYPNLKTVVVAGEKCPQNVADVWAERALFVYGGGRTETTIVNTLRVHVKGKPLNFGGPIPNTNLYILNDEMTPLPIGEAGFVWTGGAGVTKGYINLPNETTERYKLDSFRNDGSFMFNTGDYGRWRSDGNLEYIGGVDDQITGEAPGSPTEASLDSPPAIYDGTSDVYLSRLTLNQETPSGRSSPNEGKESMSKLEDGNAWDGYQEDVIPEKTQNKVVRNLRHQIFDLYRRLFGVVFIANMGLFIATLVRGGSNANHLGLIVISNLFCSILMRQDYVINAFFVTFTAVPRSWPLWIRRVAARVYHIGGLHSGSGVSGLVWLIYFVVQATKEVVGDGPTSVATLTVSYIILLLLVGIVSLAHPSFRKAYHNHFEITHRFLGWTAVALVWAQAILLTNDYRPIDKTLGQALMKAAPFWLVVVMTISIILPWLRLRKIKVRSEVLSNHAVRIYYDYVTPIPGSFTRVSDNPLMEWHGFATIAEPGKKGYSHIVSRAGDWTSGKIANPPDTIWVRGIPTFGVMNIVPMFRRLIIVATGSGIAPCAPHILRAEIPIRLLWTSPNVRQTFGDSLVDSILDKEPEAVIYDTRLYGKPDMVKLTYRMFREFNAEAVCIISNETLTRKVVYGLTSRGIPAFGAIWDS